MKKTLLASSLLFALSANAAWTPPIYIENAGVVTNNSDRWEAGLKERVLGGYHVTDTTSNADDARKELNSQVKVTGGDFNYVVGGHYVDSFTSEMKQNVASTSVEIDGDDTKVYFLAAGTTSNDAGNISNHSSQSNLVIHGGTFGAEKLTTDVHELLVLGGDLMKAGGTDGSRTAVTSIDNVDILIENGIFNSAVVGGSGAYAYYRIPSESIQTSVDHVDMTITGGTFNHVIIAGGLAGGHNAKSHVETTRLYISGESGKLNVNCDIFAGGLYTNTQNTTKSTVGKAYINIENATVKGVYGSAAETKISTDQWTDADAHWVYDELSNESGEPTDLLVDTSLTMTNVTAETVDIAKGKIELRAEGAKGGVSVQNFSNGDATTVRLTADGDANDAVAGQVDKLFDVQSNGEAADYNASIQFDEGLVMGAVTGEVKNGKVDESTIRVGKNTVQDAMLDQMSMTPVTITRILSNDVRKRLGDIRSAQGTHGVWARYDGGQFSGNDGFDSDFNTIQVGYDTLFSPDAPRLGVAFSYTNGDSDFGRGESEMDAYSLAVYGTKMFDNGMFVDVIGRVSTIDNDMTIDGHIDAKTDNIAWSLSGEYGWRFDLTKQVYIEPQAELAYTRVDSDSFKLSDVKYELDSTDSLIGRIGVAAGLKCANNKGDVYLRVSGVHEFLGDAEVSAKNAVMRNVLESDGKDTWVEFNIGANFNINESTYVYADVERTEGAKLDEDWRANLGVRYSF